MSVLVHKHSHEWQGYAAVVSLLGAGVVLLWMLLNDWAKVLPKWLGC
jgi:hypothetical protein